MSAAQKADRLIEVLLVEDSPGDVRLMQEAFRDVDRLVRLRGATDGVEAMALYNIGATTPIRRARI